MTRTTHMLHEFLADSPSVIHGDGGGGAKGPVLETLIRTTTTTTTTTATGITNTALNAHANATETVVLNESILNTPASASSSLPEIPNWVIGALAGAMSFMFIVALVLFLAQFPPEFGGLKWCCGMRRGYAKVAGDDNDDDSEGGPAEPSSYDTKARNEERLVASPSRLLRRRRARDLGIDTSLATPADTGLGIAVHCLQPDIELETLPSHVRPRKWRDSCDEETLCWSLMSPGTGNMANKCTATAPLLSSGRQFSASGREDAQVRRGSDVESGVSPTVPATQVSAASRSDIDTSYHTEKEGSVAGAVFLGNVNAGVCRFADKMSRMFYDRVVAEGEEKGLLLPVRDEEREAVVMQGVFAGVD